MCRHLPHRVRKVARTGRGRDQADYRRHARHRAQRGQRRAEAGRRVLLSACSHAALIRPRAGPRRALRLGPRACPHVYGVVCM